jgi:spore germination protein GerM
MRYKLAAFLVAVVVLTISCGVPSSSKFTAIDKKNIPFGLSETTAAPTTSTTIALESTTTVVQPATTIATETVLLFFVAGTQLVPVTQLLPSPASLAQTMSVLETGPPREFGVGLRTAIPEGSQSLVNVAGGVVTVDLPTTFFNAMAPQDQRLAIAQIVVTLTNQRGVGQVRFTQNDAPISVLRGGGDLTQPGQLLVSSDYDQLLSGSPATNTLPTVPPTPTVTSTTIAK